MKSFIELQTETILYLYPDIEIHIVVSYNSVINFYGTNIVKVTVKVFM